MIFLILLRSIVATFLFPFYTVFIGVSSIAVHYLFHNRRYEDWIVAAWGRGCCWMSGVEVTVDGKQNIPVEGCLFLFNHTSFFDVFAMVGYIHSLRFGAKAELFKIPIFAQAMRATGTLPIARNNREEVYKIYDEAKIRFANREKFALSPEGGRFYTGKQLSPFKAGPFLFAMSAKAPIVPVVVLGAYEALPKGRLLFNRDKWKRSITLKILDPIQTSEYPPERRRELQQLVYQRMNSVWMENHKGSVT